MKKLIIALLMMLGMVSYGQNFQLDARTKAILNLYYLNNGSNSITSGNITDYTIRSNDFNSSVIDFINSMSNSPLYFNSTNLSAGIVVTNGPYISIGTNIPQVDLGVYVQTNSYAPDVKVSITECVTLTNAGDTFVNGQYTNASVSGGAPLYCNGLMELRLYGGMWEIYTNGVQTQTYNSSSGDFPGQWNAIVGQNPIPIGFYSYATNTVVNHVSKYAYPLYGNPSNFVSALGISKTNYSATFTNIFVNGILMQ